MFRYLVTISIVGIFFLQSSCVRQKNLEQVGSAARALDWTMKAVANESRKIPGVIDVRVSYKNRVE